MRWHIELSTTVVIEAATQEEASALASEMLVKATPVRVALDIRDRVGEIRLEQELDADIWPAVEALSLKPYGMSLATGQAIFTRDDADAIRAYLLKES